jgi:phosphatidylserine/phosphatidylglycerophosphate/cardiolipin synthase-like enzyme
MNKSKWLSIALLVLQMAAQSATPAQAQTQIFDNGSGLESVRGSPILDLIRNAKELNIEIYEMRDKEVQTAIREAVGRRAKVRILMEPEPMGNGSKQHLDQLRLLLGDKFRFFNKANCGQAAGASRNCFLHAKMILATDYNGQRSALISTGNFNATNLCNLSARPSRCNRDYTVVTRDAKVIDLLTEIFEADFKGRRYDLEALMVRHAEAAARLTVSPFSKKPLVKFIQGAKRGCRLQVENQYLKDRELTAALMAAGARGVRVEVTLASPCSFGPLQASAAEQGQVLFASAEASRVKIRYFTGEQEVNGVEGYMHAKAMVVSGCPDGSADRVWVGSVNGSTLSADFNREFGLIVAERDVARFLSDIMHWDHHNPDAATWREVGQTCPAEIREASRRTSKRRIASTR